MSDFFDRLISERDELKVRISKLSKFLCNSSKPINKIQIALLNTQLSAMNLYLYFLNTRIENLEAENGRNA